MNKKIVRWMAVCAAGLWVAGSALATNGTWTTTGNTDYGTTNNWLGGVIAGGAGSTLFSYTWTGIDLPVPATAGASTNVVLGNIVIPSDATTGANILINPGFGAYGHTGLLILDSGVPGLAATIQNNCITNTGRMKIRADIQLKSDLFISYNATNLFSGNRGALAAPSTALYLTGKISEDGTRRGLTVANGFPQHQIALLGDNTFSGDIVVGQGQVRAQAYTRLGGEGHQFGRDNTVIATNAGSQVDLGGFTFGADQRLRISGCGVGGFGVLAASQQAPCYTSVWSGPITLVGDSAVGMGYCSYYPRKIGGAIALAGTIDDQGAGRKLIKNSLNALFLRGTNTYSGGTIFSNGYLSATCKENLGTGPLVFAGGALLFETPWDITSAGVALTNAPGTWHLRLRTADQNITFSNALNLVTADVYKSGLGTLTLTRTGKHGNLVIWSGAVNLDYTNWSEPKLPSAYNVTLYNNASLKIFGGTQPFTNTVNSVIVGAGCAGTLSLSGAAGTRYNLEGGALSSVAAGASLDLRVQSGTDLDLSRANYDTSGIMLNSRMTHNGTAYVSKKAWNDGTVIPFATASTNWDNATPRHMDVTALTPATVPTDARIRTLRFNDAAAGQLTLQGDTGLTNGAILVTAAMGTNAVHIQGGTLTSAQSSELIVHQYNTQAVLRISSILTNTLAGGLILTKTGPGTLILSDVANCFSGTVYVVGGALEIESAQAFGVTNREVYVFNGSTLCLRGQQAIVKKFTWSCSTIYCNEAGGKIDLPTASDRVTLVNEGVGMQTHGLLTKIGKGILTLNGAPRTTTDTFLSIPTWNFSVEEGTLDIGTADPMRVGGECSVKLTVKNNAVLRGGNFLYGKCSNNGGGNSEDDQGLYHLVVDGTGGIVDLNGISVGMGALGAETYSSDFISGPGRLTVTNSSGTAATVSLNGAHLNRFTGVFGGAKYYTLGSAGGGGIPNGEFSVPAGAAVNFGSVSFPYTLALGRLTGTGSFGGKCQDSQAGPPLLVGRDMAETFEHSGYLWGTYNSLSLSAFPFRYTKVGSSTWRISGTTNAMTGDVTIRNGTILVGANSPGNGAVGALGTASVLLGDSGTAASNNVALLTDGPYTVGNAMALSNANPNGTTTLGGHQATGASSFTNALVLTRSVILTSANADSPNGVTFSGKIIGPGGITKTGVGTVYLTGVVSNTGPTVVQAGTLVMPGGTTLTNAVTVTAGAAGMGTLAVNGNLTLGAGATLTVAAGTLVRGQTYTLMTWTGSRSGVFAPVTGLPTNWHVGYYANSVVLYYALPGTLISVW